VGLNVCFLMQKGALVMGQGNICCLYYLFGKRYATCRLAEYTLRSKKHRNSWQHYCFFVLRGIKTVSFLLITIRKPLSQKFFLIIAFLCTISALHCLNLKNKQASKHTHPANKDPIKKYPVPKMLVNFVTHSTRLF